MTDLIVSSSVDVDAEIEALARCYAKAGGIGIDLLNSLGAQADGLLQRLPQKAQDGLQDATVAALNHAMTAAHKSRDMVPDQAGWLNSAVSAAMGAVGGMGGLPTALAELPVTTTLLLRVINGVAAEHGFDTSEENVRFDCVHVFTAAGPLDHDDSAEIAFLSARMALSGTAMQAIIARVAPRLATVLGQKLAAQAVPVLGAVAGAATNYAYTSYYTDMAHVHFGLRRLAIDADVSREVLVDRLRQRMNKTPVKRA